MNPSSKSPLQCHDPEMFDLIEKEYTSRNNCLTLIASENAVPASVLEANGSILTNGYFEGYPGARYYGGGHVIDEIESVVQQRCLDAFGLLGSVWEANVQALSGSAANFCIYSGVLKPGETALGMKLTHGGHLTHGACTPSGVKLSNSSKFFTFVQYGVDQVTGLIDYDEIERLALEHQPKLIVVGASAYPRDFDYLRMREICDLLDPSTLLLADISHYAGLIATNLMNSPFEYCDLVMTTTHKTLGGPRGAIIFSKGKTLSKKINASVFPGNQGGAHYNAIAAIGVAMRRVKTHDFYEYMNNVLRASEILAGCLEKDNFNIVTGGTCTHMVLFTDTSGNMDANHYSEKAEKCNVIVNKNTIPGDKSALRPSGIRVGTACMIARGMQPHEMPLVAEILKEVHLSETEQEFEEIRKQVASLVADYKYPRLIIGPM